jgi:TonB-linked SusC/RagA family outer membrane protein
MTRLRWLLAVICAVAVAPAALEAQDRGTITGTVVEQGTGRPLPGVQVRVSGTPLGTLTNQQGRFLIPNVPTGTREVRANLIGFGSAARTVAIAAGETQTVTLELTPTAVELDAVVVTATGEQRARELANAVGQINAEQVMETQQITNLSELLTGRVAGVRVLQSSGTTGTNQRIRIRGSTSMSLNNDPIIFIDGVRVYSSSTGPLVTGGQVTSSLNSINPEEIETLEVIKGPSAATLYGTDAANGVIRITTKRGRAGAPTWRVFSELGRLDDINDYPLNYTGLRTPGGTATCAAYQVALGACTQAEFHANSPLVNPEFSPLTSGHRRQLGASVSGGSENVQYFVSGETEGEVGVWELPAFYRNQAAESGLTLTSTQLRPNSMDRNAVRTNVNADLGGNILAGINVGYTQQTIFLPQNDNNSWGVLGSGLLGNAFTTDARNQGWGWMNPLGVFSIETQEDLSRLTMASNLSWNPIEWFTGRASLGLDNTNRNNQRFMPVGQVPVSAATLAGERWTRRTTVMAYSGDVGGTASFTLSPTITSRTSLGVQYYRQFLQFTDAYGQQLPPGSKSAGAGAQQSVGESTFEDITLGTFVEQQLGFRDRLYLTGALRSDDHSAFGQDFSVIIYPKFGASFVAIDQGDRSPLPALETLRLRTAWGAAGRAPGGTDAILFFEPQIASVAGTDRPGVTFDDDLGLPGSLGNPFLEPERSEELEVGADLGFLNGRLGLELTYYNRDTRNLLVNRPLAPSVGTVPNRFENLGRVSNRGFEAVLNTQPVTLRNFRWDLNVAASTNRNRLEELGLDADSILFTPQRFQEGFPLGAFFGERITFEDTNGNGIIEPSEITRSPTAEYIGSAFPEREIGIQSSFTLFDRFRVSALLDHKGGFYQYNFTEEFRCRQGTCRGLADPTAPLDQQARAVQAVVLGANRSPRPFIEDASFWKLRELSFQVTVPDHFASRVGATNASLVLSGRNLATWTDYTGLDPEINQVATANFTSREFLTQPSVRTWALRLNLGF